MNIRNILSAIATLLVVAFLSIGFQIEVSTVIFATVIIAAAKIWIKLMKLSFPLRLFVDIIWILLSICLIILGYTIVNDPTTAYQQTGQEIAYYGLMGIAMFIAIPCFKFDLGDELQSKAITQD